MPKRTNQFQKLIYLIKEQVAEESKVIESKMLPDLITGTKREVKLRGQELNPKSNIIQR